MRGTRATPTAGTARMPAVGQPRIDDARGSRRVCPQARSISQLSARPEAVRTAVSTTRQYHWTLSCDGLCEAALARTDVTGHLSCRFGLPNRGPEFHGCTASVTISTALHTSFTVMLSMQAADLFKRSRSCCTRGISIGSRQQGLHGKSFLTITPMSVCGPQIRWSVGP